MSSTKRQRAAKYSAIKAHADLGLAVVAARAHAAAERARVDVYVAPILASYAFRADAFPDLSESGHLITSADDLYLTADPRLPAYFAEVDTAHRAHGFTGPANYCPALIAEHDQIKAENALIQATAPIVGIEPEDLWNPTHRAEFLRLTIGMCELAEQERIRVRQVAHEIAVMIHKG